MFACAFVVAVAWACAAMEARRALTAARAVYCRGESMVLPFPTMCTPAWMVMLMVFGIHGFDCAAAVAAPAAAAGGGVAVEDRECGSG